jgi:predicted nucleic acid-binding protein
MTTLVVDASALIRLLLPKQPDPDLYRRLMLSDMVAPDFVDLEVLNTLRRELRRGALTTDRAEQLAARQINSPVTRVPHRSLLSRVWELRGSVTPYDAAYLSLAEQLQVPFVTTDARLAGSNGHQVKIELFPAN